MLSMRFDFISYEQSEQNKAAGKLLSFLVFQVTKVGLDFQKSTVGIEHEILRLCTNEGGKHPFLDSRFHYGLKEHFKSFQFRKHR